MGKVSLIDGHIDEPENKKRVCKYCGSKLQKGTMCANCLTKIKLIRQIKQMLNDAKNEVESNEKI